MPVPNLFDFATSELSLHFPQELLERPMHLDPDSEHLTYGDEGGRRGAGMVNMGEGRPARVLRRYAPDPSLPAQADIRPDGLVRSARGSPRSEGSAETMVRERSPPQGQAR